MKCTWNRCEEKPTRVMGWMMTLPCFWVAPYCDEHTKMVEETNGAIPVTGQGFEADVLAISGIRK